jgi:hypothetical protein
MDENLKQFATARQIALWEAFEEHGGYRPAARVLGVGENTVRSAVARVKVKAAAQGYSPEHNLTQIVPAPFVAKGHSTYYNAEGKPTQQWVKSQLDQQAWLQMIRDAVSEFCEDVPRVEVPPPPLTVNPDLIPWVQLGDAHLGMLAHESETGKNFDLRIAEREILTAFSIVLSEMQNVDRLVLNDLGDFTHTENFAGETEGHRNRLDVDTRFPKIIRAYSRIMRHLILMLLEKATVVDVIVNQGNHSRTNDIWMRELLTVAFGHTGRVNVLNNDSPFIAYRMGNTLVMTHHGDQVKIDKLIGVMITDYRKEFGETEFHYIDTGHIHHRTVSKEHPSVTVESFNTLSPGDRYHHDKGYRARQSLSVIYRSRLYGETSRRLLPIQEVWAAVRKGHTATGVSYTPSAKKAFSV